MSRIGKKPIQIPNGVQLTVSDRLVSVKGPKGELSETMPKEVLTSTSENGSRLEVKVGDTASGRQKAAWGLARALIANMVKGVSSGFEKALEFNGVGFRAGLKGQDLELSLGYSHPVVVKAPDGITFKVEKNIITVSGASKQAVGQVAAVIKSKRPVEPYKGKGIKYVGEIVRRKAGKKAVTSA